MFFQIEKEEDVILDCDYFFDLDIVINNDGGADRGDIIYQERFKKDGSDDEGGRHGVNGRHVVNGIGGG